MQRARRAARAVHRNAGMAALAVSTIALVSSFTGAADAAKNAVQSVVSKPKPNRVLRLDKSAKFPVAAIPKVREARRADRLGTLTPEELQLSCGADTVDLGTWCLSSSTFPLPNSDIGKNDFFYATKACVELGGYLPSAAQLLGAASRVKLNSYITDNDTTAGVDIDPADGLTDRREMSSTLVTTQGGASSSGLLGVSEGSLGNPRTGEPNPVVVPAVPAPETLQYITVVDNGEKGGFAGSKPVGQPEAFRCAYAKGKQGVVENEES